MRPPNYSLIYKQIKHIVGIVLQKQKYTVHDRRGVTVLQNRAILRLDDQFWPIILLTKYRLYLNTPLIFQNRYASSNTYLFRNILSSPGLFSPS